MAGCFGLCGSSKIAPMPDKDSTSPSKSGSSDKWIMDEFGQRIRQSPTMTMARAFDDLNRVSVDLESSLAPWKLLLQSDSHNNHGPQQCFIDRRMSDPNGFASMCICGIPFKLRCEVWLHCSGALDLILERGGVAGAEKYYLELQRRMKDAPSPYARQISVDVPRTLPDHPYFNTNSADCARPALERVLHCVALELPDIGYMQGMNMIASTLLLVVDAEYQAFYLLLAFMRHYDMMDYYRDGLSRLNQSMADFGALMRAHVPKLAAHLDSEGMMPMCYATPWFITAFTYNCVDLGMAARILDFLFLLRPGDDGIIRFGLAYFEFRQQRLLKYSFTEIVTETKYLTFDDPTVDSIAVVDHDNSKSKDPDALLSSASSSLWYQNLERVFRIAHNIPLANLAAKAGVALPVRTLPDANTVQSKAAAAAATPPDAGEASETPQAPPMPRAASARPHVPIELKDQRV